MKTLHQGRATYIEWIERWILLITTPTIITLQTQLWYKVQYQLSLLLFCSQADISMDRGGEHILIYFYFVRLVSVKIDPTVCRPNFSCLYGIRRLTVAVGRLFYHWTARDTWWWITFFGSYLESLIYNDNTPPPEIVKKWRVEISSTGKQHFKNDFPYTEYIKKSVTLCGDKDRVDRSK